MKTETTLLTFIKMLLQTPAQLMLTYIRGALIALILCIGGSFYYIHRTSSHLVADIKKARALSLATEELINQYNIIVKEEEALAELLESKSDYNNLKSYFERLCKQHAFTAEPGWAETSEVSEIPGNEQFEEERLTSFFKELSTKDALSLIDTFEKDDITHLKEIELERTAEKITVKVMLTAKKLKQSMGA
jgi:site-specific DNA-adenine methylase